MQSYRHKRGSAEKRKMPMTPSGHHGNRRSTSMLIKFLKGFHVLPSLVLKYLNIHSYFIICTLDGFLLLTVLV